MMTEDDRRLKRGQLLVQMEDAESDLDLLRGEAIATAKSLERIANRLRCNVGLDPSTHDFTPEGDINNRMSPGEVTSFPTVGTVSKLIEDIKKARQEVFNLRKLKRT